MGPANSFAAADSSREALPASLTCGPPDEPLKTLLVVDWHQAGAEIAATCIQPRPPTEANRVTDPKVLLAATVNLDQPGRYLETGTNRGATGSRSTEFG